jgi:malate dehydrogenase (oxaloacetate-decarboxylating)(NADP+)
VVRSEHSVIAALMVRRGDAAAMICGTVGVYAEHLRNVLDIIGPRRGVKTVAAVHVLILPRGTFFLCDTQVTPEPSVEQIVETTLLAVEAVRRFGVTPKVALLSHSNFGSADTESARRMRAALPIIRARDPDLEIDGEMHGDSAVNEDIRSRLFPNSRLKGSANLLVMPTLDAANIAFSLLRALSETPSIGPILVGTAQPAHIVIPSVTVRGLINMSALAVVEAQAARAKRRS